MSPLYEPLDTTKSEIRLLDILSDGPGSTVNCSLRTVSLDDKPVFTALSYVWGDPAKSCEIILNGNRIGVTTNLESALRHVRRHWTQAQLKDHQPTFSLRAGVTSYVKSTLTHVRRHWTQAQPKDHQPAFLLWADAICINQGDDPAERSHQVQLMRRIYASAQMVISWLGPEDRSLAFKTIKIFAAERRKTTQDQLQREVPLGWLRQHPSLCEQGVAAEGKDIDNDAWWAVAQLLKAPYWRRVWIFQEIILSNRQLFVSTGDITLSWDDIKLSYEILSSLRESINDNAARKPEFLSMSVWEAITTPLMSWADIRSVCTTRDLLRNSHNLTPPEQIDRGWAISTFASGLKASDSKDYIYGLLGVNQLPLIPDYTERTSIADLYMEYCRGWLKAARHQRIDSEMNSLHFLSRAGIGLFGRGTDLPSWVPNFPENARGGCSTTRVATGYADRGVFVNNGTVNIYPYIVQRTRSLFVWGVNVGGVHSVSECPQWSTLRDGRLLDFMVDFKARHSVYISGIPPLQAIFRLIGRDPTYEVTKAVVFRAMVFLRRLIDPFRINDPQLGFSKFKALGMDLLADDFEAEISNTFFPGAEFRSLEFEHDLRTYIAGPLQDPIRDVREAFLVSIVKLHISWRFFETTNGYLGLAPVTTAPGDILCVLNRGDVPVVLRKASEGDFFTLIGTAFVVGLMNGEAAKFGSDGTTGPNWFEIR
ncbi:Fc.00g027430.m01.CDS01 [Cosmosporella sp. VM-42]